MDLSINRMLQLLMVVLFGISAFFILFTGFGFERNRATIIIDLGEDGIFREEVNIREGETTALNAISNIAYSVEISAGEIECIARFCNTRTREWNFYKIEETALGHNEIEVEEKIEDYILSKNEVVLFRYEVKENNQTQIEI